jgi:hypothetical protein
MVTMAGGATGINDSDGGKKYIVTATRIVNLQAVVYADDESYVDGAIDGLTDADFVEVGGEFTVDYWEEEV